MSVKVTLWSLDWCSICSFPASASQVKGLQTYKSFQKLFCSFLLTLVSLGVTLYLMGNIDAMTVLKHLSRIISSPRFVVCNILIFSHVLMSNMDMGKHAVNVAIWMPTWRLSLLTKLAITLFFRIYNLKVITSSVTSMTIFVKLYLFSFYVLWFSLFLLSYIFFPATFFPPLPLLPSPMVLTLPVYSGDLAFLCYPWEMRSMYVSLRVLIVV